MCRAAWPAWPCERAGLRSWLYSESTTRGTKWCHAVEQEPNATLTPPMQEALNASQTRVRALLERPDQYVGPSCETEALLQDLHPDKCSVKRYLPVWKEEQARLILAQASGLTR